MRLAIASIVTILMLALPSVADERAMLKLWPDGAPGEKGDIGEEKTLPDRADAKKKVIRLTNVTDPTITLYRAPSDKSNGCGVIVCPGGGYNILAWDLEGTEICEWFNSFGVTAVLLKYRVPRRDKELPHELPLQDAQRAMRLTRQNARDWGIDAERLGILGFSAGGHLTVMTGTHWDTSSYEPVDDADKLSCRPDFMIPIYAAYLGDKKDELKLSSLVKVTSETPPTFLAVTLDDKMRGVHAALLLVELKKAGVPCELHVYSKGGHGYGLRPSDNPVSGWPKRCEEWMRVSGLLKSS